MVTVLPGLPGAADDPGAGPVVEVLFDGLLADVMPDRVVRPRTAPPPPPDDSAVSIERAVAEEALAAHREHCAAWYGDLIGPLRVPAAATADVVAALQPRDHAMRITLVPAPGTEDPLADLRAARAILMDDDRVEVVGAELPLPAVEPPERAARAALAALDLSAPTWFVVPPEERWLPALDVLAEDGAENLALHVPAGAALGDVAVVLRHAVDRDLAVAVTAGELPVITGAAGCGLLNLLGAVRAALNGAEAGQVAAVLAETRPEPLAAAARRMSDADAAVARSFLPTVTCPHVRQTVDDLAALGLIAPDAA
jgi:hypothetical protein